MHNAITDVGGIKVGHYTDREGITGCTVVLCEDGAMGGVDVRGSAPGTRETDLMRPMNWVQEIHAVIITGGSAYGLDAASGVMRYLEELNKKEGVTMICSLHFLSLARAYADRIVALKDGKSVFDGSPEEIDDARFREIYGEEAEQVEIR